MAERNPAKTNSRRTTPQPAPARSSARNSRVTRSGSHDISGSDAPQANNKAQRKANDTGSDREEPRTSGRTAKDRKRTPAHEPDLSTVTENPVVGTGPGSGSIGAVYEDSQDQIPPPVAKSQGRISGISGTTARTSGSAQDLKNLALEDLSVLEVLPDLGESSTKHLSGIVPAEISSESLSQIRDKLENKRSALARSWNRFKVDLEQCLPDQSSVFIDVSTILPLLSEKENLRNQTSDWVFHAANLASLAQNLLLETRQGSAQLLEQLDMTFPKSFTDDVPGALGLQLETRTQYAIMQLSYYIGQTNFDHDLILKGVFYHDDENTLRGLDHIVGRSKEFKAARKSTLQRLDDMRSFWDQEDPIESLRINYNWDHYVEEMMMWIQVESEKIKAYGAETQLEDVVSSLKTTIEAIVRDNQPSNSDTNANIDLRQIDIARVVPPPEDATAAAQPEEMKRQPTMRGRELAEVDQLHVDSPRLKHGSAKMKQLQARFLAPKAKQSAPAGSGPGERSTSTSVAQSATPHRRAANLAPSSAPPRYPLEPLFHEKSRPDADDDWRPQEDDDRQIEGDEDEEDAFQSPDRATIAVTVLRNRDRIRAESNKENRPGFPQTQAKKSLIDPQPGAERVTWRESQEPSQDTGFQESHHHTAPRRQPPQSPRKRNAPESSSHIDHSPPKRPRFQDVSPDDEDDENRAPPTAPRPSQSYSRANGAAKQITAMQSKAPQTRKPWSEHEINTLFDLIERCGTSWALLKNEDIDGVLQDRDQVALKDKARNIKFDFLKTSRRLPRNFDRIPIPKTMVDKLAAMDIEYDTKTGERVDAAE